MSLLEVLNDTHPALRKKAVKVTSFDKKFQTLVDDMIETMIAAPGVGLAAPQVGVNRRLVVVRLPDDEESREEYGEEAGNLFVVANPKITKTSKEIALGIEACLSIPGIFGEVDRHEMIVVTGQDRYGNKFRIKAKDWLARVFQHEIDHLDGILFTDLAERVWRASEQQDEEEMEPEG
jgi:peptide deformylase